MKKMTIAERLLYTTTKLTASLNGNVISTGTGFFYHFGNDDQMVYPMLVTNKHVVKGADRITAVCHLAGTDSLPSEQFIPCHMSTLPENIISHPDPAVDLCAIPFGPILNQATAEKKPIFYVNIGEDLIPKNDDWEYFDAIEEVVMIGCPNGIFDTANNLPITRRGHTASPLSKRYNGKNEFMVDMACFPGSSGSPIFIYDRNGYFDRRKNSYLMGASRVQFVGVLYAGPQVTSSGQLILAQPPRVAVSSMMHLGNAIRATELSGLESIMRSKLKEVEAPKTDIG